VALRLLILTTCGMMEVGKELIKGAKTFRDLANSVFPYVCSEIGHEGFEQST
jgi:hypothetical protein